MSGGERKGALIILDDGRLGWATPWRMFARTGLVLLQWQSHDVVPPLQS